MLFELYCIHMSRLDITFLRLKWRLNLMWDYSKDAGMYRFIGCRFIGLRDRKTDCCTLCTSSSSYPTDDPIPPRASGVYFGLNYFNSFKPYDYVYILCIPVFLVIFVPFQFCMSYKISFISRIYFNPPPPPLRYYLCPILISKPR